MLGVQYVIQRYDTDWMDFNTTNIATFVNDATNYVTQVNQFGLWSVYEINPSLIYPNVYSTNDILSYTANSNDNLSSYINGIASEFSTGTSLVASSAGQFLLLQSATSSDSNLTLATTVMGSSLSPPVLQGIEDNNGSAPANISVQDVNPTEYQVNIDAARPFELVLQQAFNPDWNVYEGIPGSLGFPSGSSVNEGDHFMVNGFANGWYISQTGNFTLTILYQPQLVITLSTYGAIGFFVFLMGLVAIWGIQGTRRPRTSSQDATYSRR